MRKRKGLNIQRIVENAIALSNPDVMESCYCYDISEIVEEIDELSNMLPEGVCVEELSGILCGNKKTKVFGFATCNATQGHLILDENADNRIIFDNEEDAIDNGYRPCGKCMHKEYIEWLEEEETRAFYQNLQEGFELGFYQ